MSLTNLLFRIRLGHLVVAGATIILFFAVLYTVISFFFPVEGIHGFNSVSGSAVASAYDLIVLFLRCLYFSITTFTSLGFSDLIPGDEAKFLVAIEVFCGGTMIGLLVAKLVLLGSDDLTTAQSKCLNGYWIDRVTTEPTTYGITKFERNVKYGIVFFGENYAEGTKYIGGFTSNLAHVDWPRAVFRWEHSDTDVFGEGEARLRFYSATKTSSLLGLLHFQFDDIAYRYEGVSVHFQKAERFLVEGWRITDPELLNRLESPTTRNDAISTLILKYFPPDMDPSTRQGETVEKT
jgi:hypothetical protein